MTNRSFNRLADLLPSRRQQQPARPSQSPAGDSAALAPLTADELDSAGVLVLPPTGNAAAASRARQPWRAWLWPALLMLLAFTSTVLLRGSNMNRAFDIFVDEGVYLSLSKSVASTLRPITYLTNFTSDLGTFYLHPPAFFYIEAAFINLVQPDGNTVQQIHAVRWVNVLIAGLSATVLFLLGRNIAGTVAGIITALIFAIDPWVIRIDSRNLIETSASFWIVLGYCLLVYYIRRPQLTWLAVGSGVAWGLAALSKDPTVLLTLLPLGICFVLGWAIPRRTALLVGSIVCLEYALYVLVVTLAGDLPQFLFQKTQGLGRFAGDRTSGFFLAGGGPSFIEAIAINVGQYATTYALIGFGVVAVGLLLYLGGKVNRLIAVWTASAYLFHAFNIVAGTNEEHYFYYLVIPAIVASTTSVVQSLRLPRLSRKLHRSLLVASAAVLALMAVWSGANYMLRSVTPDNAQENLIAFIENNVPQGSRIATTALSSQWLLHDSMFTTGRWGTVASVCSNRTDYVVISSKLVETGHDIATPELYDWLKQTAAPVFVFQGPSTGELSMYQVAPQACASVPASDETGPKAAQP